MARIFTDGAEMGDTKFWDGIVCPACLTAVTVPTPIGGAWSYAGCWQGAWKLTSDLTEFYLRYRLRTSVIAQCTTAQMLGWRHSTTTYGRLAIDDLYRFIVYGTSGSDVASIVMEEDIWYLIELHVLIDSVNGVIEGYIDGAKYLDFAGNTGSGHIDNIYFSTNAYTTVYIDDLALNDTTGLSDNSWCGDGIITKMIPNGDGTHNDWTNSDGDKVNNYLYVDEYPNDGDLTYVYDDGSDTGTQDQYALSDLDYTNKTVLRIWPEARAKESAGSDYTLKLGILPSGGGDEMSAGRDLLSGSYIRVVGDEYTVNPVDSNPWEEADLDSLEFIAEVG